MRAYGCLVILAVVSWSAYTFANETPTESDNAPKPLCEENVCLRMYMPVCGLVDGEQVTAPSRCVLNNKIRCSSALQRSSGQTRFLHSGPCSPKADKSTVAHMRDSNEEMNEVEPSEEEHDASKDENDGSKEEDNSNSEESEHVEIHDSGESGESGELNAIQQHNVHELEDLEDQADLDDKEAEADNAEAEMDHAEEQEDSEEA